MERQDIDRSPFAKHVERCLGDDDPPVTPQQVGDLVNEAGVCGIEQAVQRFAMPEQAERRPGRRALRRCARSCAPSTGPRHRARVARPPPATPTRVAPALPGSIRDGVEGRGSRGRTERDPCRDTMARTAYLRLTGDFGTIDWRDPPSLSSAATCVAPRPDTGEATVQQLEPGGAGAAGRS